MLYTVTIEIEMVVEASNKKEAEEVAKCYAKEELDNFNELILVSEPLTPESLPNDWADCYPWGGNGAETCIQILEKARAKVAREREEAENISRQTELTWRAPWSR